LQDTLTTVPPEHLFNWLEVLLALFFAAIFGLILEFKSVGHQLLRWITVLSGAGSILLITGGVRLEAVLAAVVLTVILGILLVGPKPLWNRIYHRFRDLPTYAISRFAFPSTAELEEIVTRFALPSGRPFIALAPRTGVTAPDSVWVKRRRRAKRPQVFLKMKPRMYLPWLDAVYYLLLRDLKHQGFRPVVYLYDFDYRTVDSHTPEIPSSTDLSTMIANTESFIGHIVGCATRIIRGSGFFSQRRPAQLLHNFLYAEVFPAIADRLAGNSTPAAPHGATSARSTLFELHGYPTILVAKLLAAKAPVYALQWEGRAHKWGLTAYDREIQVLLSSTLMVKNGPLRIRNSIHITDRPKNLLTKLQCIDNHGGADELLLMCSLLLYRGAPQSYDWNTFVSVAAPLTIHASLEEMRGAGFLDAAGRQTMDAMTTDGSITSGMRDELERSQGLASAYLRFAVYTGVLAFQSEFGLGNHANA